MGTENNKLQSKKVTTGGGGGAAVNCQCIYIYCSFGARDITLVCS